MSRFLRICAVLSAMFFATNVFAAGYTCNDIKMYTSCNEGYYMTVDGTYNGTETVGNDCTLCPAGYYCTGGTANKTACPGGTYGETTGLSTSACTASCPDFYSNSDPASTSMSSCYMNTTLGNYIATANDTTETTCPADASYCPGNVRVYYGTTGGNITCPGNYTANTTAGKSSAIQCKMGCAAGYRVITPGGACEKGVVPGGWYMGAHNVSYGEVSPVEYCSTGFDAQSSAVQGAHISYSAACKGTVNAGNAGGLSIPRVTKLRIRNLSDTDTLWLTYVGAYNSSGSGSNLLTYYGEPTVDYTLQGSFRYAPLYTTMAAIITRLGHNVELTDYAASIAPGGTVEWQVGTSSGVNINEVLLALTHENAMDGSLSTVSIPFAVEVLQPSISAEWKPIYDTRTRSYADLSGVLGDGITYLGVYGMSQIPCSAGNYASSSRIIYGGSDSACASASAGYYVPGTGATAQTMCPAGKYTDTTGKSSCSTINAGYYSTGGGTSATPTATGDGCISGQECGTIAAGYWGAAGATTAQGSGEVDGGYYSTGGGTSATPTENGNGCVGDGNTCGLTDENCYSNGTGGTSSCPVACSVFGDFYKYSDKGSVSPTACHGTLEPGYAVMEDSAAVVECPAGYACPGGETIYLEQSGGYTVCTDDQYQNETGQATCKTCTAPAPYDTWLYTADILAPGTPHQFCAHYFFYGNADDPKMDEYISELANGMDLKTNPNYQPFNGGIIYGYAQYVPDNLDESANIVSVPAYINPGYWYPQAQDDDLSDEGQTYTSFQDMYEDTIVPVGSGYWSAGSTGFFKPSTRNACPTGYDDGSATASAENQCVLSTSAGKFVKTANSGEEACTCGGYCPGGINVNYGNTGGKTDCAEGTYNDGTGSSASSVCKTTSAGYYALAGSCSQTQVNANCWGGAGSKVACPNSCTSPYSTSAKGSDDANDCYLTTTSKNYVKTAGAGQTTCAAGTYCPGGSVIYKGGTVSGRNTTGGSTTCPAGSFCAAGVSAGTECVLGSYSAAGASSCTACQDGKTTSSTGQTSCNATCSNASGVSDWETASWATTNAMTNLCTIAASAGCSANYYKNNNACSTCSSGTGSKYTLSAAGTTSVNSCYLKTSTGKYVATKGAGETACISPYYCPGGTTVYYGTGTTTGGNSPCTGIASIYNASDASASKQSQCFATTSPGKYIKATGTSETVCPAGDYCLGGTTVYYGSAGGNKDCPSGYTNGTTGYSLESQCLMSVAGGKYVATAKESAASGTCEAGYAKPAHTVNYGGTSSCNKCTGATYQDATGEESCEPCPVAEAYPGSTLGYYWDTTGLHTTDKGCNATITNPTISNGTLSKTTCYLDENGDYGTANALRGSWGCEAKTTNLTCDGGYYTTKSGQYAYRSLAELAANTCTSVGSGYYSADGDLTRTACDTGLVTCGAGKCANEAADCGRILHAGNQSIYLRSAARTSPALNVKIGNQTFFGALSTSYSSALKVKNDGTTYSVVNDYQ